MIGLSGGFFGGGAPAGTSGGGAVGNAVTVLARASGHDLGSASPNDHILFTAPADGLYVITAWLCLTVGGAVTEIDMIFSYTDQNGNVILGVFNSLAPPAAYAIGAAVNEGPQVVNVKAGTNFILRLSDTTLSADEWDWIATVSRVA